MAEVSELVFVCLHGSAKSLIAAQLAERIARAKGLALSARSVGTEPDPEVPPHVVAGLLADGIGQDGIKPQPATAEALARARRIVTFGPDVRSIAPKGVPIEQWTDVPNVSDGYAAARTEIHTRVERLLERL